MKTRERTWVLWAGVAMMQAGCGAGESAPATVALWQPSGSLQCEATQTTQAGLDAAVAALRSAGIVVHSARCAQDGLMHASVCGAANGDAWRVEVSAAAVDQAVARGWRRIETGQEITPMACR